MLCISQSCQAKHRFFISAGFSGKWLKGTKDNFDISKNPLSSIVVNETPAGLSLSLIGSDPYGYGIDPPILEGFSIAAGWRLSSHFIWSVNYQRYFNRHGRQALAWSASPDGPFPERSGILDYKAVYAQHDVQFLLEFYPGWHGLCFIGGRDVTIQHLVESLERLDFVNDSLVNVSPFQSRETTMEQYPLLGIGWSRRVAGNTFFNVITTYTFSIPTGGLKLRAGVRRFIL
jgi:hypothetical protein